MSLLSPAARPAPASWTVPAARDPRWPFAGLLALYAVLGCTVWGFNRSPGQIVLTVGAACLLDMVLAYLLRGRQRLVPLSAAITGLSLALLLNYAHGTLLMLLPVYLAIGSKYAVTFRGRHQFNPSLFGVAVTLLLAGDLVSPAPAYQWGGSLAVSAFLVMAALSVFVFRIGRTPLIVSFLCFYLVQTALRAYIMRWHLPAETIFAGTLTSAPFFLFCFYMLPDPQTSPSRPRDQILLALAITLVDLWLHKMESLYTFYYAAFGVGVCRFVFLHGRAFRQAGVLPAPMRLRPLLTVGLLGLAGWVVCTRVISPAGSGGDPGFRLVPVPASHSGITWHPGDTLDRVDPRLRHIAKWILANGDSVSAGDFNNDGLLDLFVTSPLAAPPDRAVLYRNLGHFRFQRVPLPCLDRICRDPARYGLITGGLFVDTANRGAPDLFLTVAFGPCRMLHNTLPDTGRAGFVDVTDASHAGDYAISLGAQCFDFDRDGKLDLLVLNAMSPWLPDYPEPTPLSVFHLPAPRYPGDRRMFHFLHDSWYNATNGGLKALYRNTGGGGFQKLDSRRWGLPETHWSLAAGTGDLNGDGWTDLYVASDFGPDDVYLNNHGQGFIRVQGAYPGSIGRDTYKGMNASLGDLDRNGHLDIYVSNVHEPLQAEGSLLWMTGAGPSPFVPGFSDEAARRGVLNESRFGWGAAMGDMNNDGWMDILQANGMVDDTLDRRSTPCPDYWYYNQQIMRAGPEIHSYADRWADLRGRCIFGQEANRIYLNRGPDSRPQFVDVAEETGWTERGSSRGIALADLDNDGALDAAVTHPFGPLSLYRNTCEDPRRPGASARPHWIGFQLVGDGVHTSRDAVGSVVTLSYRAGGQTVHQMHEIQTANGFSAQGDRRAHFGLGRYGGAVGVRIAWYGGRMVDYPPFLPDRYYILRQKAGPGTTSEAAPRSPAGPDRSANPGRRPRPGPGAPGAAPGRPLPEPAAHGKSG